eukprot:GHVN01051089.1.p1 GENE.GHVN01051089.1~~GHVN01051089.1.p1  ORF type:complete len:710 (+),score=94.50 GHVN01051089.1:127-2256(+)
MSSTHTLPKTNPRDQKPRHVPSFVSLKDDPIERMVRFYATPEQLRDITTHYEYGTIGLRRYAVTHQEEVDGYIEDFSKRSTRLTYDSTDRTVVTVGFSGRKKRWTLCPSNDCIPKADKREKIVGQWKVLHLPPSGDALDVPKCIHEAYSEVVDDCHYFAATLCPQQTYCSKHSSHGGFINREWHEENRHLQATVDFLVFCDNMQRVRAVWRLCSGQQKNGGGSDTAESNLIAVMTKVIHRIRDVSCENHPVAVVHPKRPLSAEHTAALRYVPDGYESHSTELCLREESRACGVDEDCGHGYCVPPSRIPIGSHGGQRNNGGQHEDDVEGRFLSCGEGGVVQPSIYGQCGSVEFGYGIGLTNQQPLSDGGAQHEHDSYGQIQQSSNGGGRDYYASTSGFTSELVLGGQTANLTHMDFHQHPQFSYSSADVGTAPVGHIQEGDGVDPQWLVNSNHQYSMVDGGCDSFIPHPEYHANSEGCQVRGALPRDVADKRDGTTDRHFNDEHTSHVEQTEGDDDIRQHNGVISPHSHSPNGPNSVEIRPHNGDNPAHHTPSNSTEKGPVQIFHENGSDYLPFFDTGETLGLMESFQLGEGQQDFVPVDVALPTSNYHEMIAESPHFESYHHLDRYQTDMVNMLPVRKRPRDNSDISDTTTQEGEESPNPEEMGGPWKPRGPVLSSAALSQKQPSEDETFNAPILKQQKMSAAMGVAR